MSVSYNRAALHKHRHSRPSTSPTARRDDDGEHHGLANINVKPRLRLTGSGVQVCRASASLEHDAAREAPVSVCFPLLPSAMGLRRRRECVRDGGLAWSLTDCRLIELPRRRRESSDLAGGSRLGQREQASGYAATGPVVKGSGEAGFVG